MTTAKKLVLICVCTVLSFLPLCGATADAACVQQKLYSYYDSYQPDREENPRSDSLEDYDIDELQDAIASKQNQHSKKDDTSFFEKLLKLFITFVFATVVIMLASAIQ